MAKNLPPFLDYKFLAERPLKSEQMATEQFYLSIGVHAHVVDSMTDQSIIKKATNLVQWL